MHLQQGLNFEDKERRIHDSKRRDDNARRLLAWTTPRKKGDSKYLARDLVEPISQEPD
jgi:hypothetical protein